MLNSIYRTHGPAATEVILRNIHRTPGKIVADAIAKGRYTFQDGQFMCSAIAYGDGFCTREENDATLKAITVALWPHGTLEAMLRYRKVAGKEALIEARRAFWHGFIASHSPNEVAA